MAAFRSLAALVLTAVLGSPLLRGDDYQFLGFQVGTGRAVGALADWSSDRPGYVVGAQQLINEGEGTMFRTRLDVLGGLKGSTAQNIPGPNGPVFAAVDNTFTLVDLGLDSIFYINGDLQQGFYVFGGVGGVSTRLTSKCPGDASGGAANWPITGTLSTTSNKFYWSGGLGWQFTPRLGAEARFVMTRFSYQSLYFQDATVSLAITWRVPVDFLN